MTNLIQQAQDKNTSSETLRQLAIRNVRLTRNVATNSNANSELLIELANIRDRIVRQNVTANSRDKIKNK